jgi:hypothetical protein
MKMTMTVERITPAKAEKMLNANTCNRKLRPGVVERYAADMQAGNWTQCLVPISFYEDGEVADGQHRLWAIVEAGVPVDFFVVRDVAREAGLNIDTGLNRSIVDNAHISGLDTTLTHTFVSTARAVHDGTHGSVLFAEDTKASRRMKAGRSLAERLAICKLHHEAVAWACKHGPTGKFLRNAMVLGAVARAYSMEHDLDRLAKFGAILHSGFYDSPDETAAVTLRTHLLSKGNASASSPVWRDTFLKCQHAIYMFMRHKPLTVLRTPTKEPYPRVVESSKKAVVRKVRQAVEQQHATA